MSRVCLAVVVLRFVLDRVVENPRRQVCLARYWFAEPLLGFTCAREQHPNRNFAAATQVMRRLAGAN